MSEAAEVDPAAPGRGVPDGAGADPGRVRAEPVIETVEVACYTVPAVTPEADGTAEWNATTAVVVTVGSSGHHGIGWSYTETAAAPLISAVLAPVLRGLPVWDIPAATRAMAIATRNAGRSGVVAAAISAVDIALWDLKARMLGLALTELLGRVRRQVPVYGSGGFVSDDDTVLERELRGWLGDGIRAVKIKIGEAFGGAERRDLRRVGLAREVIGADVGLFVDANGGYSPGQARRVERALRDQDVVWFEEPVSSADPAQLAAVRRGSTLDIAAGEYVWRAADARALLLAEAVDCLQLDVTRCGGYTGWLACASLAAAHEIEVSAHCAPALSAPVACAVPNARHVEYFRDHARLEALLFDGVVRVADGAIAPDTDRHGHGMTVREEAHLFRVPAA